MNAEEGSWNAMKDTIYRQDAIEALGEEPVVWMDDDAYSKGMKAQWAYDMDAIEALPSAERKGHWILTDYPDEQTYQCSACNEIWTFIEGTPIDNGAFFCPNCGASMVRGEEE